MAERSQSPKSEKPDFIVTDTENEEESQSLLPPPQGPVTRSKKKIIATPTKLEIDTNTLLKFIKPYDGSREKLNSFLVNCNNAYELASDNQKDLLFKYILCQLHGKAEAACSIQQFQNWSQLKEYLKLQFSERKHYAHLLTELQECKQKSNENVSQYALRIQTCLSELLTEVTISHGHKSREMCGRTAAMEELALHHFQMGLVPRISNVIRCKTLRNLNDAINEAISEERIQLSLYKHSQNSSNMQPRPGPSKPNIQFFRHNQPAPNFNKANPFTSSYIPNNRPNAQTSPNPICRYCKAPGHTLETCRKREFNNNRFRSNQHQVNRALHRVNYLYDEPDIDLTLATQKSPVSEHDPKN